MTTEDTRTERDVQGMTEDARTETEGAETTMMTEDTRTKRDVGGAATMTETGGGTRTKIEVTIRGGAEGIAVRVATVIMACFFEV
jgi:hypothetical protein